MVDKVSVSNFFNNFQSIYIKLATHELCRDDVHLFLIPPGPDLRLSFYKLFFHHSTCFSSDCVHIHKHCCLGDDVDIQINLTFSCNKT